VTAEAGWRPAPPRRIQAPLQPQPAGLPLPRFRPTAPIPFSRL